MSETDRYVRINRNNLVADTNLVKKGSVTSNITNPSSETLWSRVGGRTTEYSAPFPGYCLRFNKNNQLVYIQTSIPSSERDNYKIVIKGEGTVDHLYVDTSAANIAIKQASAITDSSYFDLSYIAFVNKTTGDIDHLFECEESSGTLLYDAVRGGTASLESVTSISAMRIYANKQKEWIADYNNLGDKVQCIGGVNAGFLVTKKDVNTNLTPLRGENLRSYCFTLEVKQDFNVTNFNDGITLIGDYTAGGTNRTYGHGFFLYKNSSFGCYFGVGTTRVSYASTFSKLLTGIADWSKKIIPAGIYKLCLIVNVAENAANSYIKTYCNGINTWNVILNETNKNIDTSVVKYGTETDTIDTFRILSQQGGNSQPNYNLPCCISNVRVFGFDVSAADAAYTVEDYTNDRQIDNPSTFPGVLLYYDNLSYWTNYIYANCYIWLDRGPKNAQLCIMNNGVTARNRMECPCKKYGTWLNNAGWSKTSGSNVYIPRAIAGGGAVFELNSSMQFEHSWFWEAGTGKVEGYFEDDGTLVCKVSEEVKLKNSFSLPDLKLVGGITPNIIKDKLVRVTWESIYLNPDIYLIGVVSSQMEYGKTIKVAGTTPIKKDWYKQPNEIICRVTGDGGYYYLGTNNFIIAPYLERSKDNSRLTIPVGTILWKVKGLKLELIS